MELANLNDESEATDRQLDGFACVSCGAEPDLMMPVGFGPRGQVFECAYGHTPAPTLRGAEHE